MKKIKIFRRILSLLLVLIFTSETLFAQIPQISFNLNAGAPSEIKNFSPAILLPKELGKMEISGEQKPALYLIQDPHGHYEGQKNIQRILEFLYGKKELQKILLEGGAGRQDLELLRFFKQPEFNLKAARLLTREAETGGAELFFAENPEAEKAVPMTGIEDPAIYLENVRLFTQVQAKKPESENFLRESFEQLGTEASQSNPALLKFFKRWLSFETGKSDLESFLRELQESALETLKVDLKDPRQQLSWPMLVRYIELKNRENKLDVKKAGEEKEKLLGWAGKNRISEGLILQLKAGSFTDGRRAFWESFYDMASAKGFKFQDYPALSLAEGFYILREEMESRDFYIETEKIRDEILTNLAKTPEEQRLTENIRDFLLLRKILRLEITPSELQQIKQRLIHSGIIQKLPAELIGIYRDSLSFYALAEKRDRIMLDEILKQHPDSKHPAAVILGGFHTPGLTRELENRHMSYALVTPHLPEMEGSEKYIAAMTGEKPKPDFQYFAARVAAWTTPQSGWRGKFPPVLAAHRAELRKLIEQEGMKQGAALNSLQPRAEIRMTPVNDEILDSVIIALNPIRESDEASGILTRFREDLELGRPLSRELAEKIRSKVLGRREVWMEPLRTELEDERERPERNKGGIDDAGMRVETYELAYSRIENYLEREEVYARTPSTEFDSITVNEIVGLRGGLYNSIRRDFEAEGLKTIHDIIGYIIQKPERFGRIVSKNGRSRVVDSVIEVVSGQRLTVMRALNQTAAREIPLDALNFYVFEMTKGHIGPQIDALKKAGVSNFHDLEKLIKNEVTFSRIVPEEKFRKVIRDIFTRSEIRIGSTAAPDEVFEIAGSKWGRHIHSPDAPRVLAPEIYRSQLLNHFFENPVNVDYARSESGPVTQEQFMAAVEQGTYQFFFGFENLKYDEAFFKAAFAKLKAAGLLKKPRGLLMMTKHLDNIDSNAARRYGFQVTSIPETTADQSIAEVNLAALLEGQYRTLENLEAITKPSEQNLENYIANRKARGSKITDDAVAQLLLAQLMTQLSRLEEKKQYARSGRWRNTGTGEDVPSHHILGHDRMVPVERTVGIAGSGPVAEKLIRALHAIGVKRILYTQGEGESDLSSKLTKELGIAFEKVSLERLQQESGVMIRVPGSKIAELPPGNDGQITVDPAKLRVAKKAPQDFLEDSLAGKNFFSAGLGNAGMKISIMAIGLGMNLLALEPDPESKENKEKKKQLDEMQRKWNGPSAPLLEFGTLEELTSKAYAMTLLTKSMAIDSTDKINAALLREAKQLKIFINTDGGYLVDEEALREFLSQTGGRFAVLDVLKNETDHPENSPLFKLPNALILGHTATNEPNTRLIMANHMLDNLKALLRGWAPPGAVNDIWPRWVISAQPSDFEKYLEAILDGSTAIDEAYIRILQLHPDRIQETLQSRAKFPTLKKRTEKNLAAGALDFSTGGITGLEKILENTVPDLIAPQKSETIPDAAENQAYRFADLFIGEMPFYYENYRIGKVDPRIFKDMFLGYVARMNRALKAYRNDAKEEEGPSVKMATADASYEEILPLYKEMLKLIEADEGYSPTFTLPHLGLDDRTQSDNPESMFSPMQQLILRSAGFVGDRTSQKLAESLHPEPNPVNLDEKRSVKPLYTNPVRNITLRVLGHRHPPYLVIEFSHPPLGYDSRFVRIAILKETLPEEPAKNENTDEFLRDGFEHRIEGPEGLANLQISGDSSLEERTRVIQRLKEMGEKGLLLAQDTYRLGSKEFHHKLFAAFFARSPEEEKALYQNAEIAKRDSGARDERYEFAYKLGLKQIELPDFEVNDELETNQSRRSYDIYSKPESKKTVERKGLLAPLAQIVLAHDFNGDFMIPDSKGFNYLKNLEIFFSDASRMKLEEQVDKILDALQPGPDDDEETMRQFRAAVKIEIIYRLFFEFVGKGETTDSGILSKKNRPYVWLFFAIYGEQTWGVDLGFSRIGILSRQSEISKKMAAENGPTIAHWKEFLLAEPSENLTDIIKTYLRVMTVHDRRNIPTELPETLRNLSERNLPETMGKLNPNMSAQIQAFVRNLDGLKLREAIRARNREIVARQKLYGDFVAIREHYESGRYNQALALIESYGTGEKLIVDGFEMSAEYRSILNEMKEKILASQKRVETSVRQNFYVYLRENKWDLVLKSMREMASIPENLRRSILEQATSMQEQIEKGIQEDLLSDFSNVKASNIAMALLSWKQFAEYLGNPIDPVRLKLYENLITARRLIEQSGGKAKLEKLRRQALVDEAGKIEKFYTEAWEILQGISADLGFENKTFAGVFYRKFQTHFAVHALNFTESILPLFNGERADGVAPLVGLAAAIVDIFNSRFFYETMGDGIHLHSVEIPRKELGKLFRDGMIDRGLYVRAAKLLGEMFYRYGDKDLSRKFGKMSQDPEGLHELTLESTRILIDVESFGGEKQRNYSGFEDGFKGAGFKKISQGIKNTWDRRGRIQEHVLIIAGSGNTGRGSLEDAYLAKSRQPALQVFHWDTQSGIISQIILRKKNSPDESIESRMMRAVFLAPEDMTYEDFARAIQERLEIPAEKILKPAASETQALAEEEEDQGDKIKGLHNLMDLYEASLKASMDYEAEKTIARGVISFSQAPVFARNEAGQSYLLFRHIDNSDGLRLRREEKIKIFAQDAGGKDQEYTGEIIDVRDGELEVRLRGVRELAALAPSLGSGSIIKEANTITEKTQLEFLQDLKSSKPVSRLVLSAMGFEKPRATPEAEKRKWIVLNDGRIANFPNQMAVVDRALNGNDIELVWGPPGTGKTTVAAEVIYQNASAGKSQVVMAHTNQAVDNLLILAKQSGLKVYRLGSDPGNFDPELRENWLYANEPRRPREPKITNQGEYAAYQRAVEEFKEAHRQWFKNLYWEIRSGRAVLGGTITGVSNNQFLQRLAKYHREKTGEEFYFERGVIEEASVAPFTQSLLALSKISGKALVIGDHYQLGLDPVFGEYKQYLQERGFDEEHMPWLEASLYYYLLNEGKHHVTMLKDNFRSPEILVKLMNSLYEDLISRKKVPDAVNKLGLVVIDTHLLGDQEEQEGTSWKNEQEVGLIGGLLEKIGERINAASVGIVTPYGAQLDVLKDEMMAMLEENEAIDPRARERMAQILSNIGTGWPFQGRELPLMVVSTVRSNEPKRGLISGPEAKTGFITWNMLNVMLSRAQTSTVVFINSDTFSASQKELVGDITDQMVALAKKEGTYVELKPKQVSQQMAKLAQDLKPVLEYIKEEDKRAHKRDLKLMPKKSAPVKPAAETAVSSAKPAEEPAIDVHRHGTDEIRLKLLEAPAVLEDPALGRVIRAGQIAFESLDETEQFAAWMTDISRQASQADVRGIDWRQILISGDYETFIIVNSDGNPVSFLVSTNTEDPEKTELYRFEPAAPRSLLTEAFSQIRNEIRGIPFFPAQHGLEKALKESPFLAKSPAHGTVLRVKDLHLNSQQKRILIRELEEIWSRTVNTIMPNWSMLFRTGENEIFLLIDKTGRPEGVLLSSNFDQPEVVLIGIGVLDQGKGKGSFLMDVFLRQFQKGGLETAGAKLSWSDYADSKGFYRSYLESRKILFTNPERSNIFSVILENLRKVRLPDYGERSEIRMSVIEEKIQGWFRKARVHYEDFTATDLGHHVPTQLPQFLELAGAFPSNKPIKVFDAGSGQGVFALRLAQARPQALITGVEGDKKLFEDSRKVLAAAGEEDIPPGRIQFFEGNFNDPQWREKIAEADYVYYYDSGTKKAGELMKTLIAAMQPGSRLVVNASSGGSDFVSELLTTGEFGNEPVEGTHWVHVLRRSEIRSAGEHRKKIREAIRNARPVFEKTSSYAEARKYIDAYADFIEKDPRMKAYNRAHFNQLKMHAGNAQKTSLKLTTGQTLEAVFVPAGHPMRFDSNYLFYVLYFLDGKPVAYTIGDIGDNENFGTVTAQVGFHLFDTYRRGKESADSLPGSEIFQHSLKLFYSANPEIQEFLLNTPEQISSWVGDEKRSMLMYVRQGFYAPEAKGLTDNVWEQSLQRRFDLSQDSEDSRTIINPMMKAAREHGLWKFPMTEGRSEIRASWKDIRGWVFGRKKLDEPEGLVKPPMLPAVPAELKTVPAPAVPVVDPAEEERKRLEQIRKDEIKRILDGFDAEILQASHDFYAAKIPEIQDPEHWDLVQALVSFREPLQFRLTALAGEHHLTEIERAEFNELLELYTEDLRGRFEDYLLQKMEEAELNPPAGEDGENPPGAGAETETPEQIRNRLRKAMRQARKAWETRLNQLIQILEQERRELNQVNLEKHSALVSFRQDLAADNRFEGYESERGTVERNLEAWLGPFRDNLPRTAKAFLAKGQETYVRQLQEAEQLRHGKRDTEAIKIYEALAIDGKVQPDIRARAFLGAAISYGNVRDYSLALECVNAGIELQPQNIFLLAQRAWIYQYQGATLQKKHEDEAALQSFEQASAAADAALAVEPKNHSALKAKISAVIEIRPKAEAEQTLKQIQEAVPGIDLSKQEYRLSQKRSEIRMDFSDIVRGLYRDAGVSFKDGDEIPTEVGLFRPALDIWVDRLVTRIPSAGKIKIIDMGSGQGGVVFAFAKANRDAEVLGIEYNQELYDDSMKVLADAEKRPLSKDLKGRVRFERGDFNDPKYAAEIAQADFVYYWETGGDDMKLLQTLTKNMKPGAKLIFIKNNGRFLKAVRQSEYFTPVPDLPKEIEIFIFERNKEQYGDRSELREEAGDAWRPMPEFENKILAHSSTGRIKFSESGNVINLNPREVWIVRHGETDANTIAGMFQGQVNEEKNQLNENGRRQAGDAAEKLFEQLKGNLTSVQEIKARFENLIVLSSELDRTKDIGKAFINLVEQRTGVRIKVVEEPLLNETSFGFWENKTPAEIKSLSEEQYQQVMRYRNPNLDAFAKALPAEGYKNSENTVELMLRAKQLVEKINLMAPEKTLIMFGHGLQFNALRAVLGDRKILDPQIDGGVIARNDIMPRGVPVLLSELVNGTEPALSKAPRQVIEQRIARFMEALDVLGQGSAEAREPASMERQVFAQFNRFIGKVTPEELARAIRILNEKYHFELEEPEWGEKNPESVFEQMTKDLPEIDRLLTENGDCRNCTFLGTDAMFWKWAFSKKYPAETANTFYLSQVALLSQEEFEFVKLHRHELGESPGKKGLLRGGIVYSVMARMINNALRESTGEESFNQKLSQSFDEEMKTGTIQKQLMAGQRAPLSGTDEAVQKEYFELQNRVMNGRNIFREIVLRVGQQFFSTVVNKLPNPEDPLTIVEVARWGTQPLLVKNVLRYMTGKDRVSIRLIARKRAPHEHGFNANDIAKYSFLRERHRLIVSVESARPVSFDYLNGSSPVRPLFKVGSERDKARGTLLLLLLQSIPRAEIRSAKPVLRNASSAANYILDKIPGGGLVSLDGGTAVGKTTLLSKMAKYFQRRGREVEFLSLDDLMMPNEWRNELELDIIRKGQPYYEEWRFWRENEVRSLLKRIQEFYKSDQEEMRVSIPRTWDQKKGEVDEINVFTIRKNTIVIVDWKYANRIPEVYDLKLRVQNDPAIVHKRFLKRKRPLHLQEQRVQAYSLAYYPSYKIYAADTAHQIDAVLDFTPRSVRLRQFLKSRWNSFLWPFIYNKLFYWLGIHWIRSLFVLKPLQAGDLGQIKIFFFGAGRLIRGMLGPKIEALGQKVIMLEMLGAETSGRIISNKGRYEIAEAFPDGHQNRVEVKNVAAAGSLDDPAVRIKIHRILRNTRENEIVIPFGVTERGIVEGSSSIRELTAMLESYAQGRAGNENARALILNTDNVSHNGDQIKQLVLKEAGKKSAWLAEWIEAHAVFLNSIVDRITVAGKNAEGKTDPTLTQPEGPLPKELAFFVPPSPALADGSFIADFLKGLTEKFPNVKRRKTAEQLEADEALKLRVLLAVHKSLSPAAAVAGYLYTKDAVRVPPFEAYLRKLYDQDLSIVAEEMADAIAQLEPDLNRAKVKDYVRDFFNQWMERLRNPFIEHNNVWISRHMTMKIGDGFGPMISALAQAGARPPSGATAFAIAAILRFLTPYGGEEPAAKNEDPIFKGQSDPGTDYGPRHYYDSGVYIQGDAYTFRDGNGATPRMLRPLIPLPGIQTPLETVRAALNEQFYPAIQWQYNGRKHSLSEYPELTEQITQLYWQMLNGTPVLKVLNQDVLKAPPVKILLADPWPGDTFEKELEQRLARYGGSVSLLPERLGDADDFRRLLEREKPQVIILRSRTKLFENPELIQYAKEHGLKILIRSGAGIENIDLEAAEHSAITVARTNGTENSASDAAMRFLFAALEKGHESPQQPAPEEDIAANPEFKGIFEVPLQEWNDARERVAEAGRGTVTDEEFRQLFPSISPERMRRFFDALSGQTISLLGFGRTAQAFARKLQILRELMEKTTGKTFTVMASSPSLDSGDPSKVEIAKILGVQYPGQETVLKSATILSLHLPAAARRHLDAKTLAKAGNVHTVLNISRQGVIAPDFWEVFAAGNRFYFADVDKTAEVNALQKQYPGRIFVSPHLGGSTATADRDTEQAALETVETAVISLLGYSVSHAHPLDIRNNVALQPLRAEIRHYLRPEDEDLADYYRALMEDLGFERSDDSGRIRYRAGSKPFALNFNLILIPHGDTDANARGIFHGRYSDGKPENSINDKGKQQTREGGAELRELIARHGWNFSDLVFKRTPLSRTEQTSGISLEYLKDLNGGRVIVPEIEEQATEIDFGKDEWDGKTREEIIAALGKEEAEWIDFYRNLNAFSRAPSGENFLMLTARIKDLFEKWNKKYAGKTIVLYGHKTFSIAASILLHQPGLMSDGHFNWRLTGDAVLPRGRPTLIEKTQPRSEIRLSAVDLIKDRPVIYTKSQKILEGFEETIIHHLRMQLPEFGKFRKMLLIGTAPAEAAAFARENPNAEVYVIDVHLEQIKKLEDYFSRRPNPRVKLFRADASYLDPKIFENGTFDFIFASGLDESAFYKPEEALIVLSLMRTEELRLLADNGILLHFASQDYRRYIADGRLIRIGHDTNGIFRKPVRAEIRAVTIQEINLLDIAPGEKGRLLKSILAVNKDSGWDFSPVNRDLEEMIAGRGVIYKAVDKRRRTVGYAWLDSDQNNSAYLYLLAVRKNRQKRKIGQDLMERVYQNLRKNGIETLMGAIDMENEPSLRFFDKQIKMGKLAIKKVTHTERGPKEEHIQGSSLLEIVRQYASQIPAGQPLGELSIDFDFLPAFRPEIRTQISAEEREKAIRDFWRNFTEGNIKDLSAEAFEKLGAYGLRNVLPVSYKDSIHRATVNADEDARKAYVTDMLTPLGKWVSFKDMTVPVYAALFIAVENALQHSRTGGVLLFFDAGENRSLIAVINDGKAMSFSDWKNGIYSALGNEHKGLKEVEKMRIDLQGAGFSMQSGGFKYNFRNNEPEAVETPALGTLALLEINAPVNLRPEIRTVLEVAKEMTAKILPVAKAEALIDLILPATLAQEAVEPLTAREKEILINYYATLFRVGGKAVLPAEALRTLESGNSLFDYFDLILKGAERVNAKTRGPVVYVAGQGSEEIKNRVFSAEHFRINPSFVIDGPKIFSFSPQSEVVVAERLKRESLAVSFTREPEEKIAVSIPAFLLDQKALTELSASDRLEYLSRLTQLQLLAAEQLKYPAEEISAFLAKAGIEFERSAGGFIRPSAQSLLSEKFSQLMATQLSEQAA